MHTQGLVAGVGLIDNLGVLSNLFVPSGPSEACYSIYLFSLIIDSLCACPSLCPGEPDNSHLMVGSSSFMVFLLRLTGGQELALNE